MTKVTVAGCADKPVCPLKHKTNVSFEVDFKVGGYLMAMATTIYMYCIRTILVIVFSLFNMPLNPRSPQWRSLHLCPE